MALLLRLQLAIVTCFSEIYFEGNLYILQTHTPLLHEVFETLLVLLSALESLFVLYKGTLVCISLNCSLLSYDQLGAKQ